MEANLTEPCATADFEQSHERRKCYRYTSTDVLIDKVVVLIIVF